MLTYRQNEIMEFLQGRKYAKVQEIAKHVHASDSTIRRELTALMKLGLLERSHGGAISFNTANEINIAVRREYDTKDKHETVLIARNYLPDFNSVFIDNSSTALLLARTINFTNKIVVTNGIMLALELSQKENVQVYLAGGNLKGSSTSTSGGYCINFVSNFHYDLMLCSCAAISPKGAFETSIEQLDIKRAAMRNSTSKILLVDKNKLMNTAPYRTAELSDFSAIVTNADDGEIEAYKAHPAVKIINDGLRCV